MTSKSEHRKERMDRLLDIAAWHYVNTSHDGLVIAHLIGISPRKLFQMSQHVEWKVAVRYWIGHKAKDVSLRGEAFKDIVMRATERNSLNIAKREWLKLFLPKR